MEEKGLNEALDELQVFIVQAVDVFIALITLPFRVFFALLA